MVCRLKGHQVCTACALVAADVAWPVLPGWRYCRAVLGVLCHPDTTVTEAVSVYCPCWGCWLMLVKQQQANRWRLGQG